MNVIYSDSRGLSAMTHVHASLRIPGTARMPELLRLIQDVEAAGFDGAGILDSAHLIESRSREATS